MYAIIQSGSKQYRVSEGDQIDVELLKEAEIDSEVTFDNVLLVAKEEKHLIGSPTVSGAFVKGVYLGDVKGEKITSMKYKRRKQERLKFGHRQKYARVKITEVACDSI